jgi:ketosteroid isomerase-like protein
MKNLLLISLIFLFASNMGMQRAGAKPASGITHWRPQIESRVKFLTDTMPPADVMAVITAAIYSLNNFNIDAVANLYTPNAVISDDEPPYSWNGPTAGIQWVNAVERTCKDNRLTKLKGSIESVNIFQQSNDNIYVVVPVTYKGMLPGKTPFEAEGAFTFVLRLTNGKWLIKSQAWMPRKGM